MNDDETVASHAVETVLSYAESLTDYLQSLDSIGFLFLGGRYLLDMFGLIDAPNPRWIGWFVDDLFGMGMSAKSSQAVVWAMTFIGISLIITSIDYLYVKVVKRENL